MESLIQVQTATQQKMAKSESSENLTSDGKAKKACYITNSPLGNDFTDSIWSGFQAMKDKGWEVKSIEVSEEGEYAEQIVPWQQKDTLQSSQCLMK